MLITLSVDWGWRLIICVVVLRYKTFIKLEYLAKNRDVRAPYLIKCMKNKDILVLKQTNQYVTEKSYKINFCPCVE